MIKENLALRDHDIDIESKQKEPPANNIRWEMLAVQRKLQDDIVATKETNKKITIKVAQEGKMWFKSLDLQRSLSEHIGKEKLFVHIQDVTVSPDTFVLETRRAAVRDRWYYKMWCCWSSMKARIEKRAVGNPWAATVFFIKYEEGQMLVCNDSPYGDLAAY